MKHYIQTIEFTRENTKNQMNFGMDKVFDEFTLMGGVKKRVEKLAFHCDFKIELAECLNDGYGGMNWKSSDDR